MARHEITTFVNESVYDKALKETLERPVFEPVVRRNSEVDAAQEDEGFISSIIRSVTDPIMGAGRATVEAAVGLVDAKTRIDEADRLRRDIDNFERLAKTTPISDKVKRSQRQQLLERAKRLSAESEKFLEELPEQEKVIRDFGSTMLLVASLAGGISGRALSKTAAARLAGVKVSKLGLGVGEKALATSTFAKAFPKITMATTRGGVATGAFFSSEAAQEGKDIEDIFKDFGIGFAVGTGFELAIPVMLMGLRKVKGGVNVALGKTVVEPAGKALAAVERRFPEIRQIYTRSLIRMKEDFGEEGRKIVTRYNNASKRARGVIRLFDEQYLKTGIITTKKLRPGQKVGRALTEEERWFGEGSLLDAAQGKKNVLNSRVRNALAAWDDTRRWVFGIAIDSIDGFTKRSVDNYFPHHVPHWNAVKKTARDIALGRTMGNKGSLRWNVLYNAVHKQKRFGNTDEAAAVLDGWIEWAASGGRKRVGDSPGVKAFAEWLMKDQGIDNADDALALANRTFLQKTGGKRLPEFGSLEKSREINFPFWNPDPGQVIPEYMINSVSRLSVIDEFGKNEAGLARLISSVRKGQGQDAAKELDKLVRKMMGTDKRTRSATLAGLRNLNTLLLSFAQILNLGQTPTNVLLASDHKSLWYGWRMAFTDEGVINALRSGAISPEILRQTIRRSSGGDAFASRLLNATGFTWTEHFNRVVSANAGMRYFEREVARLIDDPGNIRIAERVAELGGDVPTILRRNGVGVPKNITEWTAQKAAKVKVKPDFIGPFGDTNKILPGGGRPSHKGLEIGYKRPLLTENEVLEAGNTFTTKTQFLNNPENLPAFASSEIGRTISQFKTFAFHQVILLKDEFRRDPLRTAIILGTVFPMTGEVILDLRSLVTQEKRPTKALDRYLDNITSAGAYGLVFDLYQSAKWGRSLEFFAGPTAGLVGEGLDNIAQMVGDTTGQPEASIKFMLRRTGFGRVPANIFFPTRRPGKSSLESLGVDIF